jgi:diaminohydroxyphosphoribosylaminopyrimidine deaminase / 5-amino-6-(5-phosphoribosylamino)uracil reductase
MTGRPVPGAVHDRSAGARPGDAAWMSHALELAEGGWGRVSPNPLVGAVVVRDGRIVGEGAHRDFGGPHAEIEALQQAGAQARGADLYVTLEPCTHFGKTPPCVDAIIAAGISRVIVAVRDPNPEAGGGVERLQAAGISVVVGVKAEEASELNAPFLNSFRLDRPWVTLKLAISLDAAISTASGTTSWLTGTPARQRVHRIRAGHDAVAVGMGTVLADDPLLTVRDAPPPRVPPTRVVFSRQGRLPLTSRLAQRTHEAPVLVFAGAPDPSYDHSLRGLGVEVINSSSLDESLQALRNRGILSLLVEGGASLTAAFLEAGLVDRMILFQAPVLLGKNALPAFAGLSVPSTQHYRFRLLRSEWVGVDHMMVFAPREH